MSDGRQDGFIRRTLGRTGLEVSEVSLGCWTLGGPAWSGGQPVGWGGLDQREAVRALHRALELGQNHFDTADSYGNGQSERLLGKAVRKKRQGLVLATKVGWFPGTAEYAYHPLHIRHQLEQSLVNLGTDYVDLYYFHHGDFGPGDCYLDDAVETMRCLQQEGKIRFIGQSAYSAERFESLVPRVDPDVLQARASMLDVRMIRPGSPVAILIRERNLGFVAFSPLAQGLLLDKYRADKPPVFPEGDNRASHYWFKPDFLKKLSPRIGRLKERFGGAARDLVRASLQYLLSYPEVSCVIPGFRDTAQVEMNLAAAGQPLSGEDTVWIQGLFGDLALED